MRQVDRYGRIVGDHRLIGFDWFFAEPGQNRVDLTSLTQSYAETWHVHARPIHPQICRWVWLARPPNCHRCCFRQSLRVLCFVLLGIFDNYRDYFFARWLLAHLLGLFLINSACRCFCCSDLGLTWLLSFCREVYLIRFRVKCGAVFSH